MTGAEARTFLLDRLLLTVAVTAVLLGLGIGGAYPAAAPPSRAWTVTLETP